MSLPANGGQVPANGQPTTEGGAASSHSDHSGGKNFPLLMLGTLGVVFGDIGTSPIYAFRAALHTSAADGIVDIPDVLGLLSLIAWALTLIVTVKYVLFVIRADNRGEGGTLSLMALARASYPVRSGLILAIGICGVALFFGDAVITPAISVLSAMEGLEIVAPALDDWVVPLTVLILAGVFWFQRFGTGRVAAVFGPVTALWFLAIGASGLYHILEDVRVLHALNPYHAVAYFFHEPDVAFVTVGAVFLAVTGAEGLYADLGHFGRKPIVTVWLAIVFPSLLLNYFGQGAFVMSHDGAPRNPFFEMVPEPLLIPFLCLTAIATVIASQAVITGAYSLARQAVQLSLLPRFEIRHTSETQSGQIYLPRINLLLAVAVIVLVLGFRESNALASAYGISVTGVMLMTTILLFIVMRYRWKWSLATALTLTFLFGVVDLGFFTANAVKFFEGGWVSLGVAAGVALIMATWVRGTRYLFEKTRKSEIPLDFLAEQMMKKPPQIVPGTAVFLTSDPQSAPTALMHSLKHYKVLHDRNIILSVVTAQQPRVPDAERVSVEKINDLFLRVALNFGYMEQPNVPGALAQSPDLGWKFDIMTTSFFLSRRSLKASPKSGMPTWQDKLFIGLARTAADATEYFQIPTGRVVEIGTQVTI